MNRLALFLGSLERYGSRLCVHDEASLYTYAQLLDELLVWKCHLDRLGIEPGSVVGIRADYSTASIAALLAVLSRPAVAALIPSDHAVTRYLEDAHVTGLIEIAVDGAYVWHRLPAPSDHPLLRQLREAHEGGLIIFTSGSTGRAKAALHSIERFLYKFSTAISALRTLAFLQFDHIAGLDTLFYTLAAGGTLVLTRRRDPVAILEAIEAKKIEVLPASPSFLRMLCVFARQREYETSSLKVITYGSEPMDASTLDRLNTYFQTVKIRQKYGATEFGSPKTTSRGSLSLWLKVSAEGVQTKVVDGVLWVRSEGQILGYLNAPQPFDEKGWYCTGDLVDTEGEWIKVLGRTTEIINVGGQKVTPSEVEDVILQLDFVLDVVASGDPHVILGQVVGAQVVVAQGGLEPKEAAKKIRLHCRNNLARFKVPVRIEIVPDGFVTDRHKKIRQRLHSKTV